MDEPLMLRSMRTQDMCPCAQRVDVQVKSGERPERMAEENQRQLRCVPCSDELRRSRKDAIEARIADITAVSRIAVRLAVAKIIQREALDALECCGRRELPSSRKS